MNFDLPSLLPKITKDFLLSKNSEETYMSTYLGIPIKKGLLISPLRQDHKPTASFYRNSKGDLIFHDFGIGFHGNFIDVVMYLNNCTYRQALHIIASDFNYIPKNTEKPAIKIRKTDTVIENKRATLIQIENQPFSTSELKWWESFGIHEKTLKKFRVFSCKNIFLNGYYYKSSSTKSPAFGYYGGKRNGIELWRIYFPAMREYRFLSNWTKEMIQGATQLSNDIDKLIITKSMKDVLNLYESNIPAIAPCSETVLISKLQMDKICNRTRNILYLGDNDLPGVKAAHKYKKTFPFLRCIFIKRKYAKDISDLYKNTSREDYNEAINELNNIFNEKEIKETKHFWIF